MAKRREHVSLIIKGPKKSAKRAASRHGVPMASCVSHGQDVQCFVACTPSTRDRLDKWYGKGPRNRSTQRTWSAPGTLLYVGGSCLSALGARSRRKRRR
jgi:Cys-tRNA synthase (O-phospho-L-seryl-tRNA:Cys-tRNA synthase)